MRGRCHNKKGKEEAGSRAAQAPKRRAHRLDSGAWVCVGGSPARPTETDWGPCVDGAISSPVVLHTAGKRQAGLVAQRQSPWVLCSLPMGRHAWHQGGPGCPCWSPLLAIGRVPERRGLGAPPFRLLLACCPPASATTHHHPPTPPPPTQQHMATLTYSHLHVWPAHLPETCCCCCCCDRRRRRRQLCLSSLPVLVVSPCRDSVNTS